MGVKILPGDKIERWLVVSVVVLAIGLSTLVASCGDAETTATTASTTSITQGVTTTQAVTTTEAVSTTQAVTTTSITAPPPTTSVSVPAAMSKAEIARWKTDAIAFNDRFYGAWPDADATFTQFTDDAAFYDPSNGDFLIEGKKAVVDINRGFFNYFPDIKVHQKAMYLSADGAANRLIVDTIWPPWVPEPANHAPVGTLEVFGFRNGLVTRYEEWFWAATLEMLGYGVFTPAGSGSERLQEIADRYLAAWASGDKARIAALYNKDATFSDSMRGLQAQGPAAIAQLGDKRFGSAGKITFEIIDLCVQTNGPDPPTKQLPAQGAIIGVGIHYRCNLVIHGKPSTVEGLTTFELGTRQGSRFAPDPNGLITREEVFYDADSLLASGLMR
jgi:SnoaL-like domain